MEKIQKPDSKEECLEILDRFKGWNKGQRSYSLALFGVRTTEDDILDAQRALILAAAKRLTQIMEGEIE